MKTSFLIIIVTVTLVVIAVAVASSLYGVSQMMPVKIISSEYQFSPLTFEDRVKQYDMIVVATVSGIDSKLFDEYIYDTDENGNEYVFDHNVIPRQAITLNVEEYLKDNTGAFDKTIIIYDDANDMIGKDGNQKARYVSEYAGKYHVGEKSLFFINKMEWGLYSLGHTGKYDISKDKNGKEFVTSEFEKSMHKEPLDFQTAKNTAKPQSQN